MGFNITSKYEPGWAINTDRKSFITPQKVCKMHQKPGKSYLVVLSLTSFATGCGNSKIIFRA